MACLGRRRQARNLIIIALLFFGLGNGACVSMPRKMQKLIEQGKYDKAVETGEKYLAKTPSAKDAQEVKDLVMEADYRKAVQLNTLEAYEAFERKYTGSRFQKDVRERKSVVYYQKITVPAGTVEAYQDFLDKFPESSLVPDARRKLHELAWEKAKQENTVAAYQEYRRRYPDSPRAAEAYQAESEAAWKEACRENTMAAYQEYQRRYPDSPRAAEAYQVESEAAWREAQKGGLEELKTFLRAYPDSPHAKEAEERTMALAWEDACRKNTWAAYHDFLEQYPNAPQRKEAEVRERNRWGFEAPLGPDEYATTINMLDDRDPQRIELYFQVWAGGEEVVGGLFGDHFSVYENGCPAEILAFRGMESERPVDIIFVFDTTGSMGEEINGAKRAMINFADWLRLRNRDVRLGLVTFGDEIRKVYPADLVPTSNIPLFQSWVEEQVASGGGDSPENDLDAMNLALRFKFRPAAQVVFILITDAPCHESNSITSLSVGTMAERLKAARVTMFLVVPDLPQYQQLAKLTSGSLFVISVYPDFSDLVLRIGNMTARQYQLVYRGTECGQAAARRQVRVRARRDYIWVRLSRPETRAPTSLVMDQENSKTAYLATADRGLLRTTDGGLTWEPLGRGLPETAFDALYVTSRGVKKLLALSRGGTLYFSRDGGESWSRVETMEKVLAVTQSPADLPLLFATDGGSLFATTDGGVSWKRKAVLAETPAQISLAFDSAEGGRLFVMGPGQNVRVSTDAGETFRSVNLNPEMKTDLSYSRLFFHPDWRGFMFLLTPDGRLFMSLDKAATWNLISPPPAAEPSAGPICRFIGFDPTLRHWLILATSVGLFASTNNGRNWFALSDGMDTQDKNDLIFAVAPDGRLLMAGQKTGNVYQLSPVLNREFFPGTYSFDTGKANLRPALISYLDELAEYLLKNPGVKMLVEGHTDDVGSEDSNMALSLKRAEAVRDYLVKRGVAPERIFTAGYGETRPLFPNTNEENRRRNRRVELTLIGEQESIPPYRR